MSTDEPDHWVTTKRGHEFDYKYWQLFARNNIHIPIAGASVYIILLFLLQEWMQTRQPFVLRVPLILWNGALAVISIAGAVRCIPGALNIWRTKGLYDVCCYQPNLAGVRGFWMVVFVLCKIAELGNSIFIVLRRKRLIILHWLHHATFVVLFAWISIGDEFSLGSVVVTTNFLVQSLVYTYYSIRVIGYRLSPHVAVFITATQLIQMFIGIFVILFVFQEKINGRRCESSALSLLFGLSIYAFHGVILLNFLSQNLVNEFQEIQDLILVNDFWNL